MIIFNNHLIIRHIKAISKHRYYIKIVFNNYFCQTPINLPLLVIRRDVNEIVAFLRFYAA